MLRKIVSVIAVICLLSTSLSAAVAFDSKVSGATSASYTFNNVAGDLVAVCVEDDPSPSAVTYNGVSMSKVGDVGTGNGKGTLWILQNAPTGSHTLAITSSGGYLASVAASYSGTALSGQPDSSNTGTSVTAALTVSTTVVASNSWLVGCFMNTTSTTVTAAGGTTIRQADAANLLGALLDSNGTVGTGSQGLGVTDAWTWAGTTISIAPAVASTAKPENLLLLGVSR